MTCPVTNQQKKNQNLLLNQKLPLKKLLLEVMMTSSEKVEVEVMILVLEVEVMMVSSLFLLVVILTSIRFGRRLAFFR